MSGGKFSVPNDRICVVLFGLVFAFIGLFAVLLVLNEVLLGITDVTGDDLWGTLFILVLFTIFAVIGISEVIRGLTIRSDRLSLKNQAVPMADNVPMLGAVVTGARFFYTWAFRVILFVVAGVILAGGLALSAMSLSSVRWSEVRPTIWLAIFVALLILPTIVLVFLNFRRRRA